MRTITNRVTILFDDAEYARLRRFAATMHNGSLADAIRPRIMAAIAQWERARGLAGVETKAHIGTIPEAKSERVESSR
jgi:hypothetical protein